MNKQIITFLTIISIFLAACKDADHVSKHTMLDTVVIDSNYMEAIVGNEIYWSLTHPTFSKTSFTSLYIKGITSLRQIDHTISNDTISTRIPKTYTNDAGTYYLEGMAGEKMYRIATLELKPQYATGLIQSYLDAKSILSNSSQESTITSFPVDRFFNPSSTDEQINYNIADGGAVNSVSKLNNGTYTTVNINPTENEKILIGTFTDNSNSKEQTIRVLTGCPVKITIATETIYPVADGRQFFRVITNPLKDDNNKTIENGSLIYFRVSDEKGNEVSEYKAISVNGIASVWMRNPIYEGTYFIHAELCGTKSNTLKAQFDSLIDQFDYTWNKDADKIKIGPVSSKLGQYIPNGTPLSIQFNTTQGNQEMTVGFKDGYATIDLEKIWGEVPSQATVEIYNKPFNIVKKS